jgi:hypothetical protein
MSLRLALGAATIVATAAGANDLHMVYQQNRYPCRNIVTGATQIGHRDMQCGFTRCHTAIMTGNTLAHCLGVIDAIGYIPLDGCVAGVALVAGGRVRAGFTHCRRPIVTTRAGAEHLIVIEL